ncbi:MAG: OmpA/MotB domain-containing [Bacteroidetes bacterium]|nr:MAG: OmpA/MotB domain-containing [Bacteroidota bacterium]
MKLKTIIEKGTLKMCMPYNLTIKSLLISAFLLAGIHSSLQAQEVQYTTPSWWFGAAVGANFNFFEGSTEQLNADFRSPVTFHDGTGIGLYVAPLIEYYKPDTRLGLMLQAGYDSRKGKFAQINTPCNCPADLSTDLSYISFEPSLRFAPFKSSFYLYAGPRFAYNISKSFTYQQGINPAYPEQELIPDVTGDFSEMNELQISGQIGAGVDIPLSSQSNQTQFVISPFVSFQPYFGQSPRSIETWNITTIRAGAALKLGRGREIVTTKKEDLLPVVVIVKEPEVKFTVNSPANNPSELKVKEAFPIRNYVFFDLNSTEIPERYVILNKGQVADFREDNLDSYASGNASGRSKRQMNVYYNILNILGDRMVKNPNANVTLVGSSEKGPADGRIMAESIKTYLVDVFGISSSRITTSGRNKPVIPSEQPGGTLELVMLREGDRRVTIESNSPALLMEFHSGPDAPLKPVELIVVPEAPVDSYVAFEAEGGAEAYKSWTLELKDDNGVIQNFGPYTEEKVSIPTKTILGANPEGDYKVTMTGTTEDGKVYKKEATTHVVLWEPAKTEEAMRFSVIYEFNESNAIKIYEKYLTEIVTPKIPVNGKVIIHGHTDVIGDETYNQTLSLARANDVKGIIEKSLAKAGRSDVKFEVYGEGEKSTPFANKFPEERFYNRTVIIDILPGR